MFKLGLHSTGVAIGLVTALFFVISVAGATGVAEPGSQGYTVFTGIPVQEKAQTLHIQGKEVQVVELVADIHLMGVPIQPIDFPADFLLASDPSSGHVTLCKNSFEQTYTDLHNGRLADHGTAVIQISLDRTYFEITTDEGVVVYPDRAVKCWEAIDPKANQQ